MKNYKLIVTDMDGTVLGENHQITDEISRFFSYMIKYNITK